MVGVETAEEDSCAGLGLWDHMTPKMMYFLPSTCCLDSRNRETVPDPRGFWFSGCHVSLKRPVVHLGRKDPPSAWASQYVMAAKWMLTHCPFNLSSWSEALWSILKGAHNQAVILKYRCHLIDCYLRNFTKFASQLSALTKVIPDS